MNGKDKQRAAYLNYLCGPDGFLSRSLSQDDRAIRISQRQKFYQLLSEYQLWILNDAPCAG